jgi:hypothetical protein
VKLLSFRTVYYNGRMYRREVVRIPAVLGIFGPYGYGALITGAREDLILLRPRLQEGS